MQTVETIKKYQNRKLYSTKLSKYVDLSYINDLVRTDQKFVVIENKTKKDITVDQMKQALSLVKLDRTVIEMLVKGAK